MAPIKFEENIKEKLEERRIKPQSDSWSNLSARLEAESHTKNTKAFWWLGIAASVIGVLFVAKHFVSDNTKQESMRNVVINPQTKTIKTEKIEVEKPLLKELITVTEKIATRRGVENNKTDKSVKKELETESFIAEIKEEVAIQLKKETTKEEVAIIPRALTFEEAKIQEVAAQINVLDETETVITDDLIEDLLEKSQREIMLDRLNSDTTGVVNARLLLESVEQDLDASFRDRVFEALKNNYNKVRTAVAQRND
ncbi:hypothetical protein GCM10022291_13460 [Postechiella marina]|uniref:Uncharacterized protein n=1 Tax=Postechiella marina TaxID=943941 RepID=A0ABP8C607_9FLAO